MQEYNLCDALYRAAHARVLCCGKRRFTMLAIFEVDLHMAIFEPRLQSPYTFLGRHACVSGKEQDRSIASAIDALHMPKGTVWDCAERRNVESG